VNKVAKDILKNDTDAQDALQNAFTNAFKKLYQVKKYKAFKNWLHTIVRNEAIAIWEKNNKVDLIEDFQDELIQADDTLDRLNFYNMISILNIKEQKVFKLRYEDNLPIKHIAKILNTNENSIKSILRRGKAKLHEKLKPATLVFIFCIIIASTVLATCLINYIKDLFSINSIGANNDGVLMAIENLDWYQEIDMEYINLGNGYKLKVGEKCVEADGYGNGNAADDEKVRHLEYGLNALIHFADQQWPAALIWKEHTPMLLSLLEELGIDTSREFSLNGTKCIVENGRIGEAGNKWFIPSVAHDNALKRNEELLSKLLSTQK